MVGRTQRSSFGDDADVDDPRFERPLVFSYSTSRSPPPPPCTSSIRAAPAYQAVAGVGYNQGAGYYQGEQGWYGHGGVHGGGPGGGPGGGGSGAPCDESDVPWGPAKSTVNAPTSQSSISLSDYDREWVEVCTCVCVWCLCVCVCLSLCFVISFFHPNNNL